MNKNIDQLIGEIRGHAKGKIESAVLENMLEEVNDHLGASMRSRLDLNESYAQAEQGAMHDFGDAESFVKKMLKSSPALRDQRNEKRLTQAMIGTPVIMGLLYFLSITITRPTPLPVVYLLLGVGVCGLATTGLLSFRSTTLKLRALLMSAIAVWIALVGTFLANDYLSASLNGEILQSRSDGVMRQANILTRQAYQTLANLKADSHYPANGSPTRVVWHVHPRGLDNFELLPAKNKSDADASWSDVLHRAETRTSQERAAIMANMNQQISDLKREFQPYPKEDVLIGSAVTPALVGILASIHVICCLLGGIWRRRRRVESAKAA